jgi:hypothetical protein
MNVRRRRLAAGAVIVSTALIAGCATQANDGPAPAVPPQHAQPAGSLAAIASALGEQGRGTYAGVFGNLSVNPGAGTVTLYVTSTQQGQQLIAAAKAAHPGVDASRVRVALSRYTMKALDAQVARIMRITAATTAADLTVYTASVNPDASGITVTGSKDKLDAIRRKIAADPAASAAPVTVIAGTAPQATS